jgi:hypothetical protein
MGSLQLLYGNWHESIPCSRDFVVPTNCRPEFKDFVTLDKATRLGRLTADPTDYTNLEGGFYYRTSNQTLYYRNATTWVPLGSGNVTLDTGGQAQTNHGVARWSATTGYIQGSLATLDDTGSFSTPGLYQSIDNTTTDIGLILQNVGASVKWSVDHAGLQTWNTDTTLQRINAGVLGSNTSGQYFSLPNGDSRVIAQRHLGGKGNAQGNSNFRAPVVSYTVPLFLYAGHADSTKDTVFTETIPINGLAINDMLKIQLQFQSDGSNANVRQIGFFIGPSGTSSTYYVVTGVAGSAAYYADINFSLTRQSNGIYAQVMGSMNGGSTTSITPNFFHDLSDANLDLSSHNLAITVAIWAVGGASAGAITINGGFVEYKNL